MTDLKNCNKFMDLIDDSDYKELSSLSPEMERHINSCKNCHYYYLVSIKLSEKAKSAERINLWNEFKTHESKPVEKAGRYKISFGFAGALVSFIVVIGVITGVWINRTSLFNSGNIFVSAGHNTSSISSYDAAGIITGSSQGISAKNNVKFNETAPDRITSANYYYEASDLDYYYDISTQL